jgi:branched-chain amino acid transport system substrate-binding protein
MTSATTNLRSRAAPSAEGTRRNGGARLVAVLAVLTAAVLLASGCVEKVEQSTGGDTAAGGAGTLPPAAGSTTGAVVDEFGGERMSFGVLPTTPTQATGDPIRIGMINQENTPLGSFPELRLGVEAAVEFINDELDGVGGRPLELVTCITSFSVEQSQACAQQMVQRDVVAVVGGIDITSNGSIPILEANQIPYIGGIPVNFDEMRSPISFQFSGGAPGAMVAFADYAAHVQGAKKVAIAYGEYQSIEAAAIDFGASTLRDAGITDVVQVPFPVTTTDFLPVLTKANEGNPDAIFLGAADTACAPAMKTAQDLGITAKLYLVGACAAPGIAEQVGEAAVDGRIFNVEGPVSSHDREAQLYFAVLGRYADPALEGASAATVSFRGAMNLYSLMSDLGPDGVSRGALLDLVRSARNRPSFDGHAYTCDGQQVPSLPSLCSPQQILVVRQAQTLEAITDWIDVPAILRGQTG